jgi:hypothetical protein
VSGEQRLGVTSRIRRAPGRGRVWRIDADTAFRLPVIVDHQSVDPATGEIEWRFDVTVDLIDGRPEVTRLDAKVPGGMDLARMQREFRWASPLEIVTRMVPTLLERGIDPFTYELPVTGFPDAAELGRPVNERLSDGFLEEIARQYLVVGRGYARVIAAERHVSQRTVVSWIEKARRRGILTSVPQGGFGGEIVRDDARHPGG